MAVAGCRERTTCRLCESTHLEMVMSLTATPPANAFVPAEMAGKPQHAHPLDLHLCGECGHLQLLLVVDPEELFRDYVYVSSTSPVFVDHFRDYAGFLMQNAELVETSLVVEFGSNDGTLLRFMQDHGCSVLGIDPATTIAGDASQAGIPTLPEFFTPDLARAVRDDHGTAAAIVANNVFAHIDDLAGVAEGVRELLSPRGLFVFEVSYLLDVLEKSLFDTIYHEHLCYHSVRPLVSFFERHGLELIDTHPVPTHGGSIRGIVQHRGADRERTPELERLLAREEQAALDRPETFRAFRDKIDAVRDDLSNTLQAFDESEGEIAGYGAPAKATTLLHHFNLGDTLAFVVDDSPLKQGLFTPGQHIPVLPSSAIYERKPQAVLILAWNFADAIAGNHDLYVQQGGHFIVPLPEMRVI